MTTENKNNTKDINRVWIRGEIIEPVTVSHTLGEKTFWKTKISCTRLSGIKDIIPVMTARKPEVFVGDIVSLNGAIRITSYFEQKTRKRERYIYAYTIYVSNKDAHRNMITLEGVVSKEPSFHISPKGREITDLLVRVNGNNIPCICWWDNAKKAEKIAVDTKVRVRGSIQSREYAKKRSNTIEVKRIIEVSVISLDVIDDEDVVIEAPEL